MPNGFSMRQSVEQHSNPAQAAMNTFRLGIRRLPRSSAGRLWNWLVTQRIGGKICKKLEDGGW